MSTPARELVYGLRASLAVIAARPLDVEAIAISRTFRKELPEEVAKVDKAARGNPSLVRELPDREIDRLAESAHHEGICLLTKPRAWVAPPALAERLVTKKGVALALDRVRNPYNVGAILRSAAFFGLDAIVIGAPAPHPALAPQAVRVAEGGAEHVALTRTTDLADTLGRLKARGIRIVGADGSAKDDVAHAAFTRPCVVVLGNEREGLLPRVRAQCDALVALRGAGAIESLNVAVAAGLFIERLIRAGTRA